MKTSEKLIQAKSLIDTPEKWTQGEYARDSKGTFAFPDSHDAVCFCSIGALKHVGAWDNNTMYMLTKSFRSMGNDIGVSVLDFNDTHTHEEVMAGWDHAIKIAQSEGD